MEYITYDSKREIGLPIYYEGDEKFLDSDFSVYRFILFTAGSAIIELNGKKNIVMAPAVFCFNDTDDFSILEHLDLKAKTIYFDPIIVNNVLTKENLKDASFQMSESEYRDYFLLLPFQTRSDESVGQINIDMLTAQRLVAFMNSLEKELTELPNDFWRCRSRSIFLEILFFIQYLWTENKADSSFEVFEDTDTARKVLLYLHSNYEKKITLQHLTEVFHINRTTLTEEFQRAAKSSVIDYLIKLRVHMASIMIKNTELPINEIMFRSGFNDTTHFGRMFKKLTGCSPSEFRANFNA